MEIANLEVTSMRAVCVTIDICHRRLGFLADVQICSAGAGAPCVHISLAAKTIDVACDQLRPTLLHMMDVEALLVEADRASKQESSDADHKEVHHAHVN